MVHRLCGVVIFLINHPEVGWVANKERERGEREKDEREKEG